MLMMFYSIKARVALPLQVVSALNLRLLKTVAWSSLALRMTLKSMHRKLSIISWWLREFMKQLLQ